MNINVRNRCTMLPLQAQRELSKLRDKLDSYSKEAVEAKNVCSMQNVLLNQKDAEIKDKGRELSNLKREVCRFMRFFLLVQYIFWAFPEAAVLVSAKNTILRLTWLIPVAIKGKPVVWTTWFWSCVLNFLLPTFPQLDSKIEMLTQQNAQLQDVARERSNYHEKLK